jgi:hypothetical protein
MDPKPSTALRIPAADAKAWISPTGKTLTIYSPHALVSVEIHGTPEQIQRLFTELLEVTTYD